MDTERKGRQQGTRSVASTDWAALWRTQDGVTASHDFIISIKGMHIFAAQSMLLYYAVEVGTACPERARKIKLSAPMAALKVRTNTPMPKRVAWNDFAIKSVNTGILKPDPLPSLNFTDHIEVGGCDVGASPEPPNASISLEISVVEVHRRTHGVLSERQDEVGVFRRHKKKVLLGQKQREKNLAET